MNEYKRMTERDEWGNADIIGVDSGNLQGNLMGDEFNRVTLALNRFADLEDKIESGMLVELPCKVGDTVWVINAWMEFGDRTKGEPYFVTRYELVEGKATGVEIYGSDCRIMQNAPRHGVQLYVFTSKVQAETRLKELRVEDV